MKNVKWLSYFRFFNNFRPHTVVAILFFSEVAGSYALGMSVFSVIMLSSALFEIPTGAFSDLYGRKKTLVMGAIVSVLAMAAYALSYSIYTLLIGAVLEGLSYALYSGNNDSLLHDSLAGEKQEHRYMEWLGKVTSYFQIGQGVSALLGSLLASWSFRYMMWISVLPVLASVFIALKVKEPARRSDEKTNIFAHLSEALQLFKENSKLRLLSVIKIWYYAIDMASYQFNSAFINLVWPLWAIGFGSVFGKAVGAVSFSFSGRVIKKLKGPENVLYMRSIWDHISRFFALLIPNAWSPVIMHTNSVWWATGEIAENGLLQKEFTDKQRSTMASFISLGESTFFALVAYLTGLLGDWYGPVQALLILQVGKLPILYLLWRLFNKLRLERTS